MSAEHDNVEALLAGVDPADLVRLLTRELGAFVADGTTVDGLRIFTRDNGTLVITPGLPDGFVGVELRGELRWHSDVEFVRRCAPVSRALRSGCRLSPCRSALGYVSRDRRPA